MLILPLVLIVFFIHIYLNLEPKREVDLSYFYDNDYGSVLQTF